MYCINYCLFINVILKKERNKIEKNSIFPTLRFLLLPNKKYGPSFLQQIKVAFSLLLLHPSSRVAVFQNKIL